VKGEEYSHATYTLHANEAVIIEELGTDTRFQEPPFFHIHGVVSGISVVIHGTDQPYGVLGAYTTQRRPFTRDDVAFLQAIANVLAQDIARQRAEDERQRLEREAQRAEHFALLGRLAAGVSHEIRNPLGAVFLHMDLLEEELSQPSPDNLSQIPESLAEIKTNLRRMDELVWAAEVRELAAERDVAVRLDGLADLGTVAFHASTLRRAVLNLAHNALDAMPQGGTLTLQGQGTATHVQLQMRDTGCGIAAEHLQQIFEPLYTTKPGGTGLGLYIIREILMAHAGRVTVQSAVGQGTTFTLTLPRTAKQAVLDEQHDGVFSQNESGGLLF
jgi:two-component system sensor histidine kinase AtoS